MQFHAAYLTLNARAVTCLALHLFMILFSSETAGVLR